MQPEGIKTAGYLVSCVSVALLGWAAFPGAEKAGLTLVLVSGMAASVLGMGLRWTSYELERRRPRKHSPSPPSDTTTVRHERVGPIGLTCVARTRWSPVAWDDPS